MVVLKDESVSATVAAQRARRLTDESLPTLSTRMWKSFWISRPFLPAEGGVGHLLAAAPRRGGGVLTSPGPS